MKPKLLLLTLLLSLTLAACAPARSEPESGSEVSAPSSQAEELPPEPSSSGSESHSEPAAPEESSAPAWAAEGFAEGVTAYRSGELSGEEWQAFLESQPDFVWLRQYDLWPFGYKEGHYEFDADWAYLKFSSGEELPEHLTPEELWSNQEACGSSWNTAVPGKRIIFSTALPKIRWCWTSPSCGLMGSSSGTGAIPPGAGSCPIRQMTGSSSPR